MEDYREKLRLAKEALDSGSYDKETIEYIFPELKESYDERIRKEIICYLDREITLSNFGGDIATFKKWISWLKNQGHDGKKWIYEDVYLKEKEQIFQDGVDEVLENPQKYGLEKQGEQKSIDKVEPKFKVGDWILIDNPCKIINIDGNYIVQYCDDEKTREISKKFCEFQFHPWTIQDAKDGDVLALNNEYFLFKGRKKCIREVYSSHCFVDSAGVFRDGGEFFPVERAVKIYPATKEQRDLLFQKMKEAGYEWDVEKKELKKIEPVQPELPNGEDYGIDSLYHAVRILEKTLGEVEGYQSDDGILEHKCAIEAVNRLYKQKPAWSEKDEDALDIAILIIQNGGDDCSGILDSNKALDWLKSLKNRVQPQQKYDWSEKDDYILKNIYDLVQENKINPNRSQCVEECLTWLKSLKERMKEE